MSKDEVLAELSMLKKSLDDSEDEVRSAKEKRDRDSVALALFLAKRLGVGIGSIVETSDTRGYGAKRKTIIRRYRVTSIAYKVYRNPPLELWGITIRKDGKDGDSHEIYKKWKLVDASSGPIDGPSASIPENPPV